MSIPKMTLYIFLESLEEKCKKKLKKSHFEKTNLKRLKIRG